MTAQDVAWSSAPMLTALFSLCYVSICYAIRFCWQVRAA
jgi:hypothetical protein